MAVETLFKVVEIQNVVLGDETSTAITTGDNNICIGYQTGDPQAQT